MFEIAELTNGKEGGRVSFGSSHFDRREKSFLGPSRSRRIGDLNRHLACSASLRTPSFPVAVSQQNALPWLNEVTTHSCNRGSFLRSLMSSALLILPEAI